MYTIEQSMYRFGLTKAGQTRQKKASRIGKNLNTRFA
jgi:hypothetical protein